jgi:hypothetical protein
VTGVEMIKGHVIVTLPKAVLVYTKHAFIEALKRGKAYRRWRVLEPGQPRLQEERPWSRGWLRSGGLMAAILSACAALCIVRPSVLWVTWCSLYWAASAWNRGCSAIKKCCDGRIRQLTGRGYIAMLRVDELARPLAYVLEGAGGRWYHTRHL